MEAFYAIGTRRMEVTFFPGSLFIGFSQDEAPLAEHIVFKLLEVVKNDEARLQLQEILRCVRVSHTTEEVC